MNDKIQTVSKALNRLFSSYPQFQASDDAIAAYFEAVEPYGDVDVVEAVKQFLTGRVEDFNPAFAPSAPHLVSVTRKFDERRRKDEYQAYKASLPKPAPTPPPTKEELARRREFLAGLAKQFPHLNLVSAGDDPEARDD